MSDDFDAVAFMRKRREEIDREDEGLSWEERRRKTCQILEKDSLWKRLKDRMGTNGIPHRRDSEAD